MTPAEVEDLRKKHYNATLVELRLAHSDLAILRIQPDFQIQPHRPGQYSTLGLGQWERRAEGCQEETHDPKQAAKLIRRAYSLSCSVLDQQGKLLDLDQPDTLEFYVVLVRSAGKAPPALTPRLFALEQGSRLFLGEKITGRFTLESVKPTDNVLFLSTGTGEAPHNYMLWELLKNKHQGKILAACCVRYRQDLGYLGIHEQLMKDYPSYTYVPLTTREKENADQKVYIQDLITSGQMEEKLGDTLDPQRTHVFLCGNPAMIGVPVANKETGTVDFPSPPGVIELLTKRGFRVETPTTKGDANIHFEEYW